MAPDPRVALREGAGLVMRLFQICWSWQALPLVVACIIIAGCTPAKNAAAGAKSLVNQVGDRATDASITFAVRAALIDDETVHSRDIQIDTTDGVVTLRGTQPTVAARMQAVMVVRATNGVRAVVNQITVPGMPTEPASPRRAPPSSTGTPAPTPVAPGPGEV